MGTYTQANRRLKVSTPLGEDALLLVGFTGYEEISRPFTFRLEMLSERSSIPPEQIVGKKIGFTFVMPDDEERHFHGYVSRFSAHGKGDRLNVYSAEVVPYFWMLTQRSNCRVFQNKDVKQIIEQVLNEAGLTDFETAQVTGNHPVREYCVQYRETDFNFISRLMEEEGIFYYFRHEARKHVLVLADNRKAYEECGEKAAYAGNLSETELYDNITAWEHRHEFRPGKVAHADYNYLKPSQRLLSDTNSTLKIDGASKHELYDYPGLFLVKGDGDALAKVRVEEQEAPYDLVVGAGRCKTFSPGYRFEVDRHHVESEEGKKYILTAVQHEARLGAYLVGDEAVDVEYTNTFTCIPDSVTFRPPRLTPKPSIQGVQTAVVVGPAGEEIYTDEHARIKVQFHWDREGKKNENSSCWVRVAQPWAGKQWGFQFIPRIGQEVVVQFLEGDPDRPLAIGSVYNGEVRPPFALTENKTQSGIRTESSMGGGGNNELRFEDKKGSEDIYFHAEKDFHRVVENDDDLKVGSGGPKCSSGSQTIEIWKDRTETVKTGNEKVTIEKGNRDVIVKTGNDTHKIDTGNRTVEIGMGNDSLTIKMGNQTTKLDLGKSETEAMQSIELKVGQSSIKLDQTGVTIKGMMVKVEGQVQTDIKGLMTQVTGSAMLKLGGGIMMLG